VVKLSSTEHFRHILQDLLRKSQVCGRSGVVEKILDTRCFTLKNKEFQRKGAKKS